MFLNFRDYILTALSALFCAYKIHADGLQRFLDTHVQRDEAGEVCLDDNGQAIHKPMTSRVLFKVNQADGTCKGLTTMVNS
jgi:hypothetical protein